jgi:hypothetical protein
VIDFSVLDRFGVKWLGMDLSVHALLETCITIYRWVV